MAPKEKRPELKAEDLRVGATYRAKRPSRYFRTSTFSDTFNDRTILYISRDRGTVQYDSITVRDGRHYPTVTMEVFLKWVSHEVKNDG